ncbi:MAG: hypothetical protein IJW55_01585 [Clostridia bacterium]|nr:hypothetical protein [Clostridia bacterium]
MKMKKKVLLSSVLTIALCLSLIAGSTFALFTSNSEVNIAVTAGNVNVVATVLDETLATYSMGVQQTKGTFENGGEALFDGASKLILNAVTPGDMATFKIQMENKSDVTIQYRVKWNIKGELADVLTATANGAELINNTTAWEKWTVDEATTKTIDVSVLLPIEVDDTYQNANADITFTVEAVQGNAVVTDVATVEQLKSALLMGESNISLVKNIVFDEEYVLEIADDKIVTIDLNGNSISGNNTKATGAMIVNNGVLTILGDAKSGITNTAINGGALIQNNGTMVLSGGTYVGSSMDDSGYPAYAIYTSGDITIEDGTNVISDRGAIEVESGNAVINGGSFTTTNAANTRPTAITLHTITAHEGSILTINDGSFQNNFTGVSGSSIICPWGGAITIYGGNFSDAVDDTTNFNNTANFQNYMGYSVPVKVYGGTFDDSTVVKNVAEGYKVIDNTAVDGTYIVTSEGNQTIVNSNGDTVIVPEIPEGASYEIIKEEDALTDAITSGKTYIFLEDGDYTLPAVAAGKALTIAGTAEVKIDRSKALGLSGSDLSFYGVTLTGKNTNYIGYQHTAKESYTNCVIDDQIFCYAAEIEFVNCTFNQTSADAYNVWTYGSNTVSFTGCTFNSAGKALLIYSEGGATASGAQNVTIENCVFNATTPVEGKAAIEIDDSMEKNTVYVTINNTVANGFATGSVSGNTLWNHKVNSSSNVQGECLVLTVDGTYYVDNDTAIETALKGNTQKNIHVELYDDVNLKSSSTTLLGGDATETITINGNGNQLTLTTTYWSYLDMSNPNGKLVINDATVTSTQSSGTWNSYDVAFTCSVELNDVDFLKAVALDGSQKAVLNNVTITETNDYYALWICSNVEEVVLNHCEISSGRGIKIDNQYESNSVCTKLTVSNTSFATAKKAAIMVCSPAGANITLNNVDISNCAADSTNAVWVDSDAAAYYANVIVSGGTKMQEA